MRIVFHVGMGKTGTSSLQATLARNRSTLAQQGIAYPELENEPSHRYLMTVAKPYEKRGRAFDSMSPQDWSAASDKMVAALLRAAATKPRVMIVSTEYAFDFPIDGHANVASLMQALSVDVHVVAWLREPISYYRSFINQRAKLVGRPDRDRSAPAPETFTPRLRDRVGRLYATWGKSRVSLHLFEREAMIGGDIVSDFVNRALPEAHGIPMETVEQNVTTAPELDAATRQILQNSCADDIAFLAEEGLL